MGLRLFGRSAAEKAAASAEAARIKAEVRTLLDLPETAAIAVNEILCADPACPGTETVILVMVPGRKTQAFKVQSAMADVTRPDIVAALAI